MPRTNVPPGRRSKRSCSRASICREANLRLCATSAIESPRSSRAVLRSAPTESVILAPLQRVVLGRVRETPAQLVRVARLADALAELALDTQPQPQRFRTRRHKLVIARNQTTRLFKLPLPVADLRELQLRIRIVGVQSQRALEKLFCILG